MTPFDFVCSTLASLLAFSHEPATPSCDNQQLLLATTGLLLLAVRMAVLVLPSSSLFVRDSAAVI